MAGIALREAPAQRFRHGLWSLRAWVAAAEASGVLLGWPRATKESQHSDVRVLGNNGKPSGAWQLHQNSPWAEGDGSSGTPGSYVPQKRVWSWPPDDGSGGHSDGLLVKTLELSFCSVLGLRSPFSRQILSHGLKALQRQGSARQEIRERELPFPL